MFDVILERLPEIWDSENVAAIAGSSSLYAGLIIGTLWGIVMSKGLAARFTVVSNLFRLKDFTIFRLGAALIMSGTVFIYLFVDLGVIELHVPKTVILPQMVGGILFGSGVAILGLCPGTAAVALGEGSLDAIAGGLGIMAGSVVYAEFFHDSWKEGWLTIGDIGRVTFPDLLGVNHWYVIVLLLLLGSMFLIMITMMDWMFKLGARFMNYFTDFTDSLEDTLPAGTQTVSSYVKNAAERLKEKASEIGSSSGIGESPVEDSGPVPWESRESSSEESETSGEPKESREKEL